MMEEQKKSVGFECLFCLSTFVSEDLLEVHMKIHTGETSKVVAIKKECTDDKNKNVKIKGTSANIKSFGVPTCCQCQDVFSSRSLLKIHYKSVHARKLYSCDLCTSWYLDLRSLNRHKRRSHLGIVPSPKCEQCNLSFADTNLLWTHKKTVHLKTLFECKICMKTYTVLRSLQRHQRKMQHFSLKFHPGSKIKKAGHLDDKEKKLFAAITCDSYKPINYDENSKNTKPIKVEKQVSHASATTKMTGIGSLEKSQEFPVMLTLNTTFPNSSCLEVLKNQPRDEANDMFFLHLNRHTISD